MLTDVSEASALSGLQALVTLAGLPPDTALLLHISYLDDLYLETARFVFISSYCPLL